MATPDEVKTALAGLLRDIRRHRSLSQARTAASARFSSTDVYQRLEYLKRDCNMPQLVAVGNAFDFPGWMIFRDAMARADGGEIHWPPPVIRKPRGVFAITVLAEVLREIRTAPPAMSQAAAASAARFSSTNVYQRLEYSERHCNVPQLVALGHAFEIPAWQILREAMNRSATGNIPIPPGAGPRRGYGISTE